jgi:hypothetical protein
MGLIDDLTRLDEVVLPRLGRGLAQMRRGATRLRVHPLVAATGVLVIAVVATVVWHLDRPPGDGGSGPFLTIGVTDGDSVRDYVAASGIELERLAAGPKATEPIYALVSFSAYLRPDAVAAIAAKGGPELVTIAGYARVPIPGRPTTVERLGAHRLPEDLAAAMRSVASSGAVASGEAAAYGTGDCACVFALLVRAAPAVLTKLAGEGVRVIDAAPEVNQLGENVTIRPPRPEETDVAGRQPGDILDAP